MEEKSSIKPFRRYALKKIIRETNFWEKVCETIFKKNLRNNIWKEIQKDWKFNKMITTENWKFDKMITTENLKWLSEFTPRRYGN